MEGSKVSGYIRDETRRRTITTLILMLLTFGGCGQTLTGQYRDYFGQTLDLKRDSTFRLDWRFDLAHTWTSGTWTVSTDTVYLTFRTVYYTLKRSNKRDSLVLSSDERPNGINEHDFAISLMASGGQRNDGIPNRLLHRGKRLIQVDENGKLVMDKRRGISRTKKKPTWFMKMN